MFRRTVGPQETMQYLKKRCCNTRADPMGQMLPVSMIQEFWGPSVPVVSFSTLFEYVRCFVGLEDLEASASPFSLMVLSGEL